MINKISDNHLRVSSEGPLATVNRDINSNIDIIRYNVGYYNCSNRYSHPDDSIYMTVHGDIEVVRSFLLSLEFAYDEIEDIVRESSLLSYPGDPTLDPDYDFFNGGW